MVKLTAQGYCSPERIVQHKKYGTCLLRSELLTLIGMYNIHYPKNSIKYDEQDSIDVLLEKLAKAVEPYCKKEAETENGDVCILNQPFAKSNPSVHRSILDYAFRPPMPYEWLKNEREWLNSMNILMIMKQYEQVDPSFQFIDVVPIDFASKDYRGSCVSPKACDIQISDFIAAGKTDFAMVFNLDPHHMSGSHWVCCFCHFIPDDPKFGMCFFDSAGETPVKQIKTFIRNIKNQIRKIYKEKHVHEHFKLKYNHIQKQFKNTECGMFCLVFIIKCLENPKYTYGEIVKSIGLDDDIFKYRSLLFSPVQS